MKKILCILILTTALTSYSQNLMPDSLSSIKTRNFYFQTEFALSSFTLISNKYWQRQSYFIDLTGGYLVKKTMSKKIKKSIQINVYSYKETFTDNPPSQFSIKNVNFFITPEMKFLFNKNKSNKGFYATIGIGGGIHSYYEVNVLKKRNQAWDILTNVGYILPIKRFYFDFKLGAGSYFAYKTIVYDASPHNNNITSQEYYDDLQKYNPNPALKNVVVNNSTIIYKYKYCGILQGAFIPNFGIDFGVNF